MSEEAASHERNSDTANRVGRMSKIDIFPFAIAALLLGVVGLISGVWMWIDARNRENRRVLEATADENRIHQLENRVTELLANNKVITALDIVTRHANALPGTAIEADGETRIASETAVLKYGPDYEGKIDRFELDITAISALNAVADSVMFRKIQADKLVFAEHSFAPIVFPKCRSADPTEAAGALVVAGHFLNDCGLRHVEPEEKAAHLELVTKLRDQTKGMSYRETDFGNLAPNFNYLVFEDTNFQKVDFGRGVSFVNSKFLPADFSGAVFKNADFRRIRSVAVDLGVSKFSNAQFHSFYLFENNKFMENKFDGCLFLDCKITTSDFSDCDFSSSTNALRGKDGEVAKWGKLSFTDCELGNVNFSKARYSGCNFTNCMLDRADFGDAKLTYVKFSGSSAVGADFGVLDRNTTFANMNLRGADLGRTRVVPEMFTGVTLDWARVSADSTALIQNVAKDVDNSVLLSPQSMIMLVSSANSADEAPTEGAAKYMFAGTLVASGDKVVPGPSDENELFERLGKLSDIELEELRLRPENVKDRQPASFRTELKTNPHWSIDFAKS